MEQLLSGKYHWIPGMSSKTIVIAKDYSETPAGRYRSDGSYSGERFREELLYPALVENDHVDISLDETLGYGSSFLEEAFGGLIREKGMRLDEIRDKLTIISSRRLYKDKIWQYLEDAQHEKDS